ncbi:MAG: hypothetical protein IPH09_02725 [bacterium]|nr:hypothetical protein [bacterium]
MLGLVARAQQEDQQQRHRRKDQQGRRLQPPGHRRHLAIDVVGVDAGADDPAPGREALDVGKLRHDARGVVLPLPHVVDVAGALAAHDVDHRDEDQLAVRVGEGGQVAALEVGPVGVDDHPRLQVVDPEVVLALLAVVEAADLQDGGGLGLLAREPPGALLGLVAGQDVPGRLGQLADHEPLLVHHRAAQGGQEVEEDHAGEEADGQQGGQARAQRKTLHA